MEEVEDKIILVMAESFNIRSRGDDHRLYRYENRGRVLQISVYYNRRLAAIKTLTE